MAAAASLVFCFGFFCSSLQTKGQWNATFYRVCKPRTCDCVAASGYFKARNMWGRGVGVEAKAEKISLCRFSYGPNWSRGRSLMGASLLHGLFEMEIQMCMYFF